MVDKKKNTREENNNLRTSRKHIGVLLLVYELLQSFYFTLLTFSFCMNDIKPERNRCYDMDKIEIEPSKVCEACTEFANAWTKKDDSE